MDPFLGQIQAFGFNFAPRGWAMCDGQLLPISANTALFSLLGTTFGGDGRTTFALPDLRGRVAIHPGNGPGLANYRWGQRGGVESVTLTIADIPSHSHMSVLQASSATATTSAPGAGDALAATVVPDGRATNPAYGYAPAAPNVQLNNGSIVGGNTGGNLPHTNIQPYLGVYHCIAMQGIFPSRS